MRAIGIMGGTFDPIHYGHLIIAEEARAIFDLERVIFIPAGQPAHKKDYEVSSAEHRYAMTLLATAINPYFECSRIEMERPGPSYAVDTIEQLLGIYGKESRLYFITGADAILEILTWHEPHRLKSMCKFIAATRPGYDLASLKTRLPKDFLDQIEFLEAPGVNISSTGIRLRVRDNISISYMTPNSVVKYIHKHGFYGSSV